MRPLMQPRWLPEPFLETGLSPASLTQLLTLNTDALPEGEGRVGLKPAWSSLP
jgi:hypothetical protein